MTSKDFLTIIQKEANKSDYDRYLKQLVYKKVSSDEKIAIFEVNKVYCILDKEQIYWFDTTLF